jgi:hypothetical protein
LPKDVEKFLIKKIFVLVREEYILNAAELNNVLEVMTGDFEITFVTLLKKSDSKPLMEKKLNNLVKLFGEKYNAKTKIFEAEDCNEIINKLIKNKKHDLLVVQKGSRGLKDKLFRKYLVNELIYEGQIPLIVLP